MDEYFHSVRFQGIVIKIALKILFNFCVTICGGRLVTLELCNNHVYHDKDLYHDNSKFLEKLVY